MKKKSTNPAQIELRSQAEARLGQRGLEIPPPSHMAADVSRLVHELQVHQIELELQNQELIGVRAELEEALALYTDLYDFAPVGYLTLGIDSEIQKVNLSGATLLKVERQKLLHKRLSAFVFPQSLVTFNSFLDAVFANPVKRSCEVALQVNGSDRLWVQIEASADNLHGSPRKGCRATLTDISERKKAEDALREKEVQYRNLADTGMALIWRAGTDKLCTYFNEPWLKFTGRTLQQELGNGWEEAVHPDDVAHCVETYHTAFDKRKSFEMEYRLCHHSGEYRWVQDMGTPSYNCNGEFEGYIGHCFDITERKRVDHIVRASLAEKEVLLREVHHRVKNNLSSIISLINLQEDSLDSPGMIDKFRQLSDRIHSMALVHELLYHTRSLSRIDMHTYFETLLMHLSSSYSSSYVSKNTVETFVAAQGVEMDIDTAIPCGLIVNELVTNSFKYAFPQEKMSAGEVECKISVTAHTEGGFYYLMIADNGVGLPPGLNWRTTKSLGMQLVTLLAERQLKATVVIDRSEGTIFRLRFMILSNRSI